MPLPCHVPDCTPANDRRTHGLCKRHYNLAYGRHGLLALVAGLTGAQLAALAVVLPAPPKRAGSNGNSPKPAAKATPAVLAPAKLPPEAIAHVAEEAHAPLMVDDLAEKGERIAALELGIASLGAERDGVNATLDGMGIAAGPLADRVAALVGWRDSVSRLPVALADAVTAERDDLRASLGAADIELAASQALVEQYAGERAAIRDACEGLPGDGLVEQVRGLRERAGKAESTLADISEATDGGEAPVDKLAATISWMGQRYARLQCEEVPALKAERDEATRDLEGARLLVGCQEVTIAELRAGLALEQEHHGHTRDALDRAKAPRTDADGADLSLVARIERLAEDRQSREEDLWEALGEPDGAWTWPALLARAEVCRRAAEGASTPKPKPQAPNVPHAIGVLLDRAESVAIEQGYTNQAAMIAAIRALTVGAS